MNEKDEIRREIAKTKESVVWLTTSFALVAFVFFMLGSNLSGGSTFENILTGFVAYIAATLTGMMWLVSMK